MIAKCLKNFAASPRLRSLRQNIHHYQYKIIIKKSIIICTKSVIVCMNRKRYVTGASSSCGRYCGTPYVYQRASCTIRPSNTSKNKLVFYQNWCKSGQIGLHFYYFNAKSKCILGKSGVFRVFALTASWKSRGAPALRRNAGLKPQQNLRKQIRSP